MTDPEITQADRETANKAFDVAFRGETEGIDDAMAEIFARHRMLGRAEGAAQERAEIVDWLRENAPQYSHEQLADAIERGEHKRSE